MQGPLVVAALAIALGSTAVAQGSGGENVHVAGGQPAPILDQVALPPELSSVAVSSDGRSAFLSAADPEHAKRSLLWIYTAAAASPITTQLPGLVRGSLFSVDGSNLFLIQYKPAKRRQGEAQLMSVNPADGKTRHLQPLPSSASALDYWAATDSLLVAMLNEIRTIRLNGLRSGPLFRILGRNLAVASLAGSNVILVGQDVGLLLVHLDDPPGEDSMPVRASIATPAPVVQLAAAPDGTEALARLSDGSLLRVTFDPLTTTPTGTAAAVVALNKGEDAAPVPLEPLPLPAGEPTETGIDEAAAGAAGAATVVTADAAARPSAPGDGQAAPVAPEPPAPPETTAGASVAPVAAATQAEAAPAPLPTDPGSGPPPWPSGQEPQVWGRLDGPAADQVESVVLYGPNNILREAQRVVPHRNGVWSATGLEPGRYQVRLAASAEKVIVCDPNFALVEVAPGSTTQSTDLRVLRTYSP